MEAAIICAIVFYFVYRVLESLIHRKERLIVAQRAVATNKYAPLRWGLLLSGAALGIVLAFFIHQGLYPDMKWYSTGSEMLYFGLTFLFAGIGLLVSFVLERKYAAEDRKKE